MGGFFIVCRPPGSRLYFHAYTMVATSGAPHGLKCTVLRTRKGTRFCDELILPSFSSLRSLRLCVEGFFPLSPYLLRILDNNLRNSM